MYSAFFDILSFLATAPRTRKELYEHFGVSDYRRTRAARNGLHRHHPRRPIPNE